MAHNPALTTQHHTFSNGSTVTHGLTMPGSACKFSVWHDQDKRFIDADRISKITGNSLPITKAQRDYFERHRPAWLV